MVKNLKQRKTGQHIELSGAVPHYNAIFHRLKTVPRVMASIIRQFCTALVANSAELRPGPDYLRRSVIGDLATSLGDEGVFCEWVNMQTQEPTNM